MLIPFHQAAFLKSAVHLSQLPQDTGVEIAFAGRSNAGKSSALNAVTNSKGLAKTSKTPGRTQAINFFQITERYRLVDLPGYGYAEVPLHIKKQWELTLNTYLQTRTCLRGLCIIMDIRHPLQLQDRQIIDWAQTIQLPVHLLLSKADKLSRGARLNTLSAVKKQLHDIPRLTCQTFSAVTGEGLVQIRRQLSQWFNLRVENNA